MKIKLNNFYEYKFKNERPVQFKVVFLDERDIAIQFPYESHYLTFLKRDFRKEMESNSLEYLEEISQPSAGFDIKGDSVPESPVAEWILTPKAEIASMSYLQKRSRVEQVDKKKIPFEGLEAGKCN